MLRNVGTLDRAIRGAVAIIFALLIILGLVKGIGLIIIAVFGLYLVFTGIFSFCFFYKLVGIHTLRTKSGIDD